MPVSPQPFAPPPERAVFCNRTLNMRALVAVGFDMDYTLVHYDVQAWEARAFAHVRQRLLDKGLAARELEFDAQGWARGLVLDLTLGNVVKANRFGYVTRASHGSRMLSHEEQRAAYSQVWVDLSEPRWVFLNTLFSLSEVCLYAQLVDLLDRGGLQARLDYAGLYGVVRDTMNATHLEGQLKAEILADPDRFVALDAELVQTLLDLRDAGKRLFVATNSEWYYTKAMMSYTFDRYLTGGATWRDLFELVIVQARKPEFFEAGAAFDEVVDDHGLVRVGQSLRKGAVFRGGSAQQVQAYLGCAGEDILYVGDHVYADVHVSSQIRRWRTALVLRELEQEIAHEHTFADQQVELQRLMARKEVIEREQASLRLNLQRLERGAPLVAGAPNSVGATHERLRALRSEVEALDTQISPLAKTSGELGNARWGPLMRAGNDKSRLARQIERHADVYTSRVANLLWLTPFGYLRGRRGSLPHDP